MENYIDYNEKQGIGDLLFVNRKDINRFRLYRIRKEWEDCYMVEFSLKSMVVESLVKGTNVNQRSEIMGFDLLRSKNNSCDWKQVKIKAFYHRLAEIANLIDNC